MPAYKSREIDWNKEWKLILVGGVAGSLAKTTVAPLDRVKILLQVRNPEFTKYNTSWFGPATAIRDIWKADGLRGVFRGHSATLLRIFPYSALKYSIYDKIRIRVIPSHEYETFIRRTISGSLTGLATIVVTYPLDFIRTRLAVETKHNHPHPLLRAVRAIYNEVPPANKALAGQSGVVATTASVVQTVAPVRTIYKISNFYRGFVASSLGMIPYAGASFTSEHMGREWMRHPSLIQYTTYPKPENWPTDKPVPLKMIPQLIVGGLAGFLSQTISYPAEVIRRRIQVGGQIGDGRRLRIWETVRMIWSEGAGASGFKRFKGFYVGLSLGYVKIVPMHAISFFIWRKGMDVFEIGENSWS
jgi:solute carrier family 25 protein 16